MLDGYKTYIIAAAVAGIAIVEGIFGIDIPGAQVQDNWFEYILGALGLGSVRRGMTTKT